jgi:hypothetical protein
MGWGLILELLKIRRKTEAASASVSAAAEHPFLVLESQRALVQDCIRREGSPFSWSLPGSSASAKTKPGIIQYLFF